MANRAKRAITIFLKFPASLKNQAKAPNQAKTPNQEKTPNQAETSTRSYGPPTVNELRQRSLRQFKPKRFPTKSNVCVA